MVGETSKKLTHFLLVTTVFMMMMIFSPHTTRWGAAASSIQFDNGTLTVLDYQGRMEEPDLLFDSEISRMLGTVRYVTPGTKKPNIAISGCNRPPVQRTCLPKPGPNNRDCLSIYKRKCH